MVRQRSTPSARTISSPEFWDEIWEDVREAARSAGAVELRLFVQLGSRTRRYRADFHSELRSIKDPVVSLTAPLLVDGTKIGDIHWTFPRRGNGVSRFATEFEPPTVAITEDWSRFSSLVRLLDDRLEAFARAA